MKACSWLAQTPSPFLRLPYPEEWLSRARICWVGDSGQMHFIMKLQGPVVADNRGRDGQRPPCRSKQHSPPPLPCRPSQPALPVVTQQVIDPGPEGHDLVRTDQLCQQEICPVTAPYLTGRKSVQPPHLFLFSSTAPLAQSTQRPALRAHLCGPLRLLCWRELVQRQVAVPEGFSQEPVASHRGFLKLSPGDSLAISREILAA